jgi:outer membrane immunogenic protein
LLFYFTLTLTRQCPRHRLLTVSGLHMHKVLFRLALLSAVALPAASAIAADLDMPPPPPPPVEELRPATYDWSGAYVGALVGASCIDGELTEHRPAVVGPPAVAAADILWEMSGCGWKGGVLAGYNHQFENWVIGLEADWSRSNDIVKNEESTADFAFSFNHEATFRARAGYAMDDTLFFVTGGAAYAQGNLDGIIASVPNDITASHWGWSVGGGVEHAFTDQFRLKLDYLFTHYKGKNYSAACCNIDVDDFDNHEVRLGAIWAF